MTHTIILQERTAPIAPERVLEQNTTVGFKLLNCKRNILSLLGSRCFSVLHHTDEEISRKVQVIKNRVLDSIKEDLLFNYQIFLAAKTPTELNHFALRFSASCFRFNRLNTEFIDRFNTPLLPDPVCTYFLNFLERNKLDPYLDKNPRNVNRMITWIEDNTTTTQWMDLIGYHLKLHDIRSATTFSSFFYKGYFVYPDNF